MKNNSSVNGFQNKPSPSQIVPAEFDNGSVVGAQWGNGDVKTIAGPPNSSRIVGQNQNGTLSVTRMPSTDSELQLYRVLQRGNLLNYFDVMIDLGGDDVQQLCEAGEEEFLEIMSLIGMASKPLHVRRLQKSLQEFATQPHLFHARVSNGVESHVGTPSPQQQQGQPIRPIPINQPRQIPPHSFQGPGSPPPFNRPFDPSNFLETRLREEGALSSHESRTSVSPQPSLQEGEIHKLNQTAINLLRHLPPAFTDPRINLKKKGSSDFEAVIRFREGDPARLEEIRKYSAVYGRFDIKRKLEKPLSLHELAINEAAACLCSRLPSLLTRKEELFTLARQVVKDSGLPFLFQNTSRPPSIEPQPKRTRLIDSRAILEFNTPPSTESSSEASPGDSMQIQRIYSGTGRNSIGSRTASIESAISAYHNGMSISIVRTPEKEEERQNGKSDEEEEIHLKQETLSNESSMS